MQLPAPSALRDLCVIFPAFNQVRARLIGTFLFSIYILWLYQKSKTTKWSSRCAWINEVDILHAAPAYMTFLQEYTYFSQFRTTLLWIAPIGRTYCSIKCSFMAFTNVLPGNGKLWFSVISYRPSWLRLMMNDADARRQTPGLEINNPGGVILWRPHPLPQRQWAGTGPSGH
jgi:hypothetical protein